MEMEITWGNVIRVWWAYFWRNLIALIAAVVIGAIVGGILGFVMGMLGVPVTTIQFVTAPIVASIGTDSRHMLAGFYADRTDLSPLDSTFSCVGRSALVIRECTGA